MKQFCGGAKPFFSAHEEDLKQRRAYKSIMIRQRSMIMLSFINFLYREYCRAMMIDMRKHHVPGV
jgi:hypothetical protein